MACLTNYTVQCRDVNTGKTGCFFYDQTHWQNTGEFKAIGEVFSNLNDFFLNTLPNDRKACYLERNEEHSK